MNTTFALVAAVWFAGADSPEYFQFPVASCTKADAHILHTEAETQLGYQIEDIVIERCVSITTIDVENVRGY